MYTLRHVTEDGNFQHYPIDGAHSIINYGTDEYKALLGKGEGPVAVAAFLLIHESTETIPLLFCEKYYIMTNDGKTLQHFEKLQAINLEEAESTTFSGGGEGNTYHIDMSTHTASKQ